MIAGAGEMITTEQMSVTFLETGTLHPNDYNPNRMTDEEFGELVSEVKRLGRLPKPVVVRANAAGYLIIDGEHNWRAAQEAGLAEIACEVIEADDFEAMRQTYKRNQHGTHNPVLLGRMFKRMMEERQFSQRDLAAQVDVSEGTIRNALEYVQAADVRNDYAFDKLSVKQIRAYNRLPRAVGDVWLNCGADLKALGGWAQAGLPDPYWARELEDAGLLEFFPGAGTAKEFGEAMAKLREWSKWERDWCRGGLKRNDVRPYSRFYFEGEWPFCADRRAPEKFRTLWIDSVLDAIIDPSTKPASFQLTPDEFKGVVDTARRLESINLHAFEDLFKAAIFDKTGELPRGKGKARDILLRTELEAGAPDYIRASKLSLWDKHRLWKEKGDESAKRALAQKGGRLPSDLQKEFRAVKVKGEVKQAWETMNERELAHTVAATFPIYDPAHDATQIEALEMRLCVLTRMELVSLFQLTDMYREDQKAWAEERKEWEATLAAIKAGRATG